MVCVCARPAPPGRGVAHTHTHTHTRTCAHVSVCLCSWAHKRARKQEDTCVYVSCVYECVHVCVHLLMMWSFAVRVTFLMKVLTTLLGRNCHAPWPSTYTELHGCLTDCVCAVGQSINGQGTCRWQLAQSHSAKKEGGLSLPCAHISHNLACWG